MLHVFCGYPHSSVSEEVAVAQVNQLLELSASSEEDAKYVALSKWSNSLNILHTNIANKLAY